MQIRQERQKSSEWFTKRFARTSEIKIHVDACIKYQDFGIVGLTITRRRLMLISVPVDLSARVN